jgi:predicted phosphodiesterase
MRKASVGNEVLSRSLEQQTAMCEGNFQRSDTEPRRALSVLPGSIDWAEEGAMEKWYARASRWRLLDGGTLCYTQRSVIELSRSQATTSAPAAGNPIVGFRALGASWTRFLCNHPRIIAIGDVHGCITELQDLLRVCDYRPGDEVILLGDLVAKGPDSQAVVQMAREIGAKAVRGNHDHEVIRCREAMLRGHDPSYASIDHMRIARQLSQLEHEWMRTWPWYIQSEDLETIFVHAGFLPSAPLDQQLPRHMMNIRSVMENGTPSARHATGMSWARLWTGPLRVVFGHDAFMGLQIWDKCIGIDTGCVYGGRLTALLLPENRLVSVPARKMYVLPRKRSQ